MRIQRWGGGGRGSELPPEKSQNIGFLSNTGPDPIKFTKSPNQHQCWAIIGTPAKRWHADDGPILVVFGSALQVKKVDSLWKNFLDPRMGQRVW